MFRTRVLRELAKSSRMTGVPLNANPKPVLRNLYETTINELKNLPEHSFYRSATTAITQEKLNWLNLDEPIEALVDRANCLQVEQLILEAKDEIELIKEMTEFKPWEELQEQAPQGQWE